MPRTKAVRKKPAEEKVSKAAQLFLPFVQSLRKVVHENFEKELDIFITQLHKDLLKCKLSIPNNILNKTIEEMRNLPPNWSGDSMSASVTQVLDATKTMTVKKKTLTRSSSLIEDEGYLTAESSKSNSDGRQSRARSRLQKNTSRVSRSLSTRTKTAGTSVDKYKTPANRGLPPNSYGTVTPKVKPNTPQVLLRRPKQGEFALSLQGSPLLTGSVVTDSVANINIPLDDGRLLSIQPQRGLRMSQIPQLDIETRRQLETLRDNLNKVCALSGRN